MSDIVERVRLLEYWQSGNGSKGAEKRISDLEDRADEVEEKQRCFATDEEMAKMIQEVEQRTLNAVKEALKVKYAWLKALAPYFASACALITGVFAIIYK